MVTAFGLDEIVREARARTGVPGVAAGISRDGEVELAADGVRELGRDDPVSVATPFRIASITKPFTATLAAACLPLDAPQRALLSHTAGLRCERDEPLPPVAQGLFSYSNAGFWRVGALCEEACGLGFAAAMGERVLRPLGLDATGFEEPPARARGHVQEGESGHRAVPADAYPVARRPSGGLWSTVGDLLRFGAHHLAGGPLFEPQVEALGARYALGWWVRRLEDGTVACDHEGSIAGYQSLLLLVPERALVLAVLTNSWRGSGLVRRVLERLELRPAPLPAAPSPRETAGRYALDGSECVVAERGDDELDVLEREPDPVTGAMRERRYRLRPLGGGVYGVAGGLLMSHRHDFPRTGLARIGLVALPRVES